MVSPFSSVTIRAFDEGVARALGGEIVSYTVDGETRNVYAVPVLGFTTDLAALGGRVPLLWDAPDDPYQHDILPSYLVKRNDMQPAFDRAPWWGFERAAAPGARPVVLATGERGYSAYAERWHPHPFNFSYDIQCRARRRGEANALLMHLLRRCPPPWFGLRVIDSVGDVRRYDTGDFNVSDASDLADIAHRTMVTTVSWTVRGEVDLAADAEWPAMMAVELAMYNYRPETATAG